MIERVCMKTKQGVSNNINQYEVPAHKKHRLEEAVDTIKVAVNYPEKQNQYEIACVPIYGKTPLYLMSSVTGSILWSKKQEILDR